MTQTTRSTQFLAITLAAVVLACSGKTGDTGRQPHQQPAAAESSTVAAAQPTPLSDQDVINAADPGPGLRCGYQAAGVTDCKGAHPLGVLRGNSTADTKNLAHWATTLDTAPGGAAADRAAADATQPPIRLRVHAIDGGDRVWVAKLHKKGTVMVRIDADDMSRGPDAVYGIGKIPGRDLTGKFFLVVEQFDASAGSTADAVRVSRWHIYAVERDNHGTERLNPLDPARSGTFRLCRMPSPSSVKYLQASFASCLHAHQTLALDTLPDVRRALKSQSILTAFIEGRPDIGIAPLARTVGFHGFTAVSVRSRLDSLQVPLGEPYLTTFAEIVRALDTDPVWVLCGLGCCTADAA